MVLVAVAVWCLATTPTVALLLVASVAFGLCDAFFEPAAGTMPRQLVDVSDLPAYSALSQTLSRLGTMAGAAVGGCLVVGLTAGFASVLLGATFAATAAPDHLGRLGSILRLGDDCLMPLAMAVRAAHRHPSALRTVRTVRRGDGAADDPAAAQSADPEHHPVIPCRNVSPSG